MRKISMIAAVAILVLVTNTAVRADDFKPNLTVCIGLHAANSAKLSSVLADGTKVQTEIVLSSEIVGWKQGPLVALNAEWVVGSPNYFSASDRLWSCYGPAVASRPTKVIGRLYYLQTKAGYNVPVFVSNRLMAVDPPKLPTASK